MMAEPTWDELLADATIILGDDVPDDRTREEAIEGIATGLQQALRGETKPIEELWAELADDGSED